MTRRHRARLHGGYVLALLSAASLGTGCRPDDKTIVEPPVTAGPLAPVGVEPARDAQDAIPLRVASWEDTRQIIASHQGKIVVLDLWSTYCPPCIAELPGLGRLQERHQKDVVCISLNCNFNGIGSPEDEREAILKVLSGTQSIALHLISSDPDEQLYQQVGIASIPVVQVYDRSGKLVKQFDNEQSEYGDKGFSYAEHIGPYVAELVTAAPL
jgi:thiol-disulfide isomerase/thioredoxin